MWTIQIPHLSTSSAQRGRIAILIPIQSQGKDYWKMMKECILHQRGWISQKLPSFVGVQQFYSLAIFPREWIRKSFQIQGRKAFVCRTILAKEECRCWDSQTRDITICVKFCTVLPFHSVLWQKQGETTHVKSLSPVTSFTRFDYDHFSTRNYRADSRHLTSFAKRSELQSWWVLVCWRTIIKRIISLPMKIALLRAFSGWMNRIHIKTWQTSTPTPGA